MADITVLMQLEHSKGGSYGVFPDRAVTKLDVTQAGTKRAETVTTLSTTTWTSLPLGDIPSGSEGIAAIKNLDATNYVEIGYDAGAGNIYTFARLKPGEFCVFRIEPSAPIKLRANTAPCDVWTFVLED